MLLKFYMLKRILSLFFLGTFLCLCTLPSKAYSNTESASSLGISADSILNNLPDEFSSYLSEILPSSDRQDIETTAKTLTDWNNILSVIFQMIGSQLPNACKSFCLICGTILLSSLLHLEKDKLQNTLATPVSYLSSICISLLTFSAVKSLFLSVQSYLSSMSIFMSASASFLSILYAAGGNLSAAVVNETWLGIVLTLIENICGYILLPLLQMSFALVLLSGISGNESLESILSFMKNTFTALLVLIVTGLSGILAFQTSLASAADTATARTVKYATGNFIPIIGSALGDATKMVMGSIGVLKNAAGTIITFIVILTMIKPLAGIFIYRIFLGCASIFAKLLGCKKESAMISGISEILGFALAITACCTVLLLFCLTLFMKSASALT